MKAASRVEVEERGREGEDPVLCAIGYLNCLNKYCYRMELHSDYIDHYISVIPKAFADKL